MCHAQIDGKIEDVRVCARWTAGESFAVGIGSAVKVTLTCGAVPGEGRGLSSSSWAAVSSLVLPGPRLPGQARTSPAKPHLLGGELVLGLLWRQGAGVSPAAVPLGRIAESCLACG